MVVVLHVERFTDLRNRNDFLSISLIFTRVTVFILSSLLIGLQYTKSHKSAEVTAICSNIQSYAVMSSFL